MSKKTEMNLLTKTELELMTVLWKLEEASVREVLEYLPEDRKMAYTSASTIIRILEQKKIVESVKQGKAHIYKPLLSKEAYEAQSLNHIIKNVFENTPTDLVKRLIHDSKISAEERKEIKRLIDEEL